MADKRCLEQLKAHIPHPALPYVWELIKDFNFILIITKERVSKYGDYRYPRHVGTPHKVSVNASLNMYAFLLTLIHEIAHMLTFYRYGPWVKPHGKEWKHTFVEIAMPLVNAHIWPADITVILRKYFINPKASSSTDLNLARILLTYDGNDDVFLEDIPEGTYFKIKEKSDRKFIKGKKRRTRYICRDVTMKLDFTINGMARIYSMEEHGQ